MTLLIEKIICFVICYIFSFIPNKKKNFVILICSYNNESFFWDNINSALNQKYLNYRIIFINDRSTDKTSFFLKILKKKYDSKKKILIINNKTRKGSLKNKFEVINKYCKKNEIIVVLDGDDKLSNNRVLSYLNYIYNKFNIWMTFGSYIHFSGKKSYQKPYQKKIIYDNSFRKNFHPSHLRSFYTWLFKKVPKSYFLKNPATFFMTCEDKASMFPLIELSGNRHLFIKEKLYLYNDKNPNGLYKNKKKEKEKSINSGIIKSMKPLKPLSRVC